MKRFCTVFLVLSWVALAPVGAKSRPRLMVLTEIGGDPDDQQSLIRLLFGANEFEIDGLIASASGEAPPGSSL